MGKNANNKRPVVKNPPVEHGKVPRVLSPPSRNRDYPSWRLSLIHERKPFGWGSIDDAKREYIRAKLVNFESMRWADIDGPDNHFIPVSDLIRAAQKDLEVVNMDDIDDVYSLRLSGRERVFGIADGPVLKLLWWDPGHKICPSKKRHT